MIIRRRLLALVLGQTAGLVGLLAFCGVLWFWNWFGGDQFIGPDSLFVKILVWVILSIAMIFVAGTFVALSALFFTPETARFKD